MKRVFLIIVAMILIGCSSMSELRQEKPEATFSSTKDIDKISECILFGWQEKSSRFGDVFMQPYKQGKTVYTIGSIEIVDIIKSDNEQIKLSFYHQGGLFRSRINARIDVIKTCI